MRCSRRVGTQGKLFPVSQFDNIKRKELGLPQIPSKNEEVQKLFRLTGLDKLSSAGRGESK